LSNRKFAHQRLNDFMVSRNFSSGLFTCEHRTPGSDPAPCKTS
jgi:hypothetical protein